MSEERNVPQGSYHSSNWRTGNPRLNDRWVNQDRVFGKKKNTSKNDKPSNWKTVWCRNGDNCPFNNDPERECIFEHEGDRCLNCYSLKHYCECNTRVKKAFEK